MKAWFTSAVAVAVLVSTVTVTAEEDSLSAARDLYAAANYEDALLVLDKLRTANPRQDEGSAIEQYRAFCLLALGRPADAQQAIEAVVAAQPLLPALRRGSVAARAVGVQRCAAPDAAGHHPAEVRAGEGGVRSKGIQLAEAASNRCSTSWRIPMSARPRVSLPLGTHRTLAAGFHGAERVGGRAPRALAPAPLLPPAPPPEPAPPRIYGSEDANVVAPVTIEQALPPFSFVTGTTLMQGNLEVVIDERGAVESAVIRRSIYPVRHARR